MDTNTVKIEKSITRDWKQSTSILPPQKDIEVRQVSCWIIKDGKVVVISKDKVKWTIPGGHPETGETIKQSLDREIMEESGVDISNIDAELIGYYTITEKSEDREETYLQLRFLVKLPDNEEIELKPSELHEINYIDLVSFEDLPSYVKWAGTSEDFNIVKIRFK